MDLIEDIFTGILERPPWATLLKRLGQELLCTATIALRTARTGYRTALLSSTHPDLANDDFCKDSYDVASIFENFPLNCVLTMHENFDEREVRANPYYEAYLQKFS